ncbi:unnamed protein product [Macrosiphum euphorbiae]|nr:unnamed protein product [Macrosiphum euphorbiae]
MRNGLHTLFPNIYTILKRALTLPVGSVSTERNFSKLKLIKTRLRSAMGNDRLEGLMIMSCENDINFIYEEVIEHFGKTSPYLFRALH